MSRWLKPLVSTLALGVLVLAGCDVSNMNVTQFWRPISEPNIELPLDKVQQKLDFDLSQCHCGIYPTNIPQADLLSYKQDQQRFAETSVTMTPDDEGNCIQRPSLVVQECMRSRGWEVTNCSGRMPLPGGGSFCTGFVPNTDK